MFYVPGLRTGMKTQSNWFMMQSYFSGFSMISLIMYVSVAGVIHSLAWIPFVEHIIQGHSQKKGNIPASIKIVFLLGLPPSW